MLRNGMLGILESKQARLALDDAVATTLGVERRAARQLTVKGPRDRPRRKHWLQSLFQVFPLYLHPDSVDAGDNILQIVEKSRDKGPTLGWTIFASQFFQKSNSASLSFHK
ncbi:hypothetical protein [Mesorhizobium sp. WSM4989]|uniref:hypothetical protein n=2 Tax=unclassified Mesorhizobium TaxID=325217 RepID=UPI0024179BB3|nr:hypothetical protein [Mesorhizobium sp. WSM4989]MDG4920716.1 hypothetical protein [Mesorhizobium sp. WSM4989]